MDEFALQPLFKEYRNAIIKSINTDDGIVTILYELNGEEKIASIRSFQLLAVCKLLIKNAKYPLNDEIFNHPPEERLPTEICMESSLSTCLSPIPIEDEYDRTYGEIIIHGINERENTNEAHE